MCNLTCLSRVLVNAVMKAKSERRRPFIGDQLDDCRDASGLFYILPFQKVLWEQFLSYWVLIRGLYFERDKNYFYFTSGSGIIS